MLCRQLLPDDISMLTGQLQALTQEQGGAVLANLERGLAAGNLNNPVGWLLAVMKRAREGKLRNFSQEASARSTNARMAAIRVPEVVRPREQKSRSASVVASAPEHVSRVVAEIRKNMAKTGR